MNNCRVLLADDEAAILEGYKLLFDWEKYQCEVVGTAMDGREAVEKARELKPDIVIMDINLPKLNRAGSHTCHSGDCSGRSSHLHDRSYRV